jgi:predicted alpha/beta hydrolase
VDLPAGVAREWARWCRDPEYLCGARPDAKARFARWDRPTMIVSSPDDRFAPPAAVDALIARLSGARLELRRRPGLDHFDFFRPEASAVWREILEFLDTPAFTPALTIEELEADLRFGRG